jgi:predicted HTH domain antitoxin
MAQVTVNIPEDLLGDRNAEDFASQMKLAAAIYWYTRSELSMGKAAELAGISRLDFIDLLAREKIDVFQVDFEDLSQELSRG